MPLVLDRGALPRATLEAMAEEFRSEMDELRKMAESPSGRVLDPASLATAQELVRAARAVLERPGARDDAALAADVNLGYATMLAVIDLVKSHTDVPKVPPPRPVRP